MKKKVIFEGKWRIEGKDKEPHSGTLTYDPSRGLELVVKTMKEIDLDKKFNGTPSDQDTIYGRDKNNNPFTLYECITTKRPLIFFNPPHSYTISPNFGVHGYEAPTLDEVCCDHIIANISLLTNWLGLPNSPVNTYTQNWLPHTYQKPIKCGIKPGTDIVLRLAPELRMGGSKYLFCEGRSLEFKFSEKLPMKEAISNYVQKFNRFLTIMTGEPTFIDNTYFFRGDGKAPNKVTFYHQNLGVKSANREKFWPKMPACYRDISKDFCDVIQRWYKLEDCLRDILDLYFATTYFPSHYINETFLLLAHALEVYHRKNPKFENLHDLESNFLARRKRIFKNVPCRDKKWLAGKLAFANEKTLARRLDEIIESHGTNVDKFTNNRKDFPKSIRYTRNHYTHYATSKKKMKWVAEDIDLFELTIKMRALLEICIFSDLKIPNDPIDKIIKNVKEYNLSKF